jgi:hypothetical protein
VLSSNDCTAVKVWAMTTTSNLGTDHAAPSLRALYDAALGPYLAAQDSRVLAARRNRWLVLIAGLALAGGLLA